MWHFLSTASVVPPDGQGLKQLGELALAFVLSSLIGIEREWRQKSAGLRTHTLVGTGAALFLIVSKYGFTDVLGPHVILDPSRVAAQIASGIGLIGGGLIFVRGDGVRGLTTAAIVWITAAIGMARGAGLAILALAATVAHFIVVFAYPSARGRASPIPIRRIRSPRHIRGRPGDLREILSHSTRLGFSSPGSRHSSLIMRFAAFPPSRSHFNCKDSRPSSSSPSTSTTSTQSSRSPAAISVHRPTDPRPRLSVRARFATWAVMRR